MILTGTEIPLASDSQLIDGVPLGPTLATGEDLANIASQALGTQLKFEDISEYVRQSCPDNIPSIATNRIPSLLHTQSGGPQSPPRPVRQRRLGDPVHPRILLPRARGQDQLRLHRAVPLRHGRPAAGASGVLQELCHRVQAQAETVDQEEED